MAEPAHSRRALLRFAAIVVTSVGLLLLAYREEILGRLLEPLVAATARVAEVALQGTGLEVVREGTVISLPGSFAYNIHFSCIGFLPISILVVGVLAYPGTRRGKLAWLAVAVPGLLVLNIVRLVSIFVVGVHWPHLFPVIHKVVWETAIALCVLCLWLGWVRGAGLKPVAARRREGEPEMMNGNCVARFLLVVALCSFFSGCTWIALSTARKLASREVEKELTFRRSSDPDFEHCLLGSGGSCESAAGAFGARAAGARESLQPLETFFDIEDPESRDGPEEAPPPDAEQVAAYMAAKVLNSKTQTSLNNLYNIALGFRPNPAPRSEGTVEAPVIRVDRAEIEKYLDDLEVVHLVDGWDALEVVSRQRGLSEAKQRMATFIKEYYRAYFRAGHFFAATLDLATLKRKMIERMINELGLNRADAEKVVTQLLAQAGMDQGTDKKVFGKIGTTAFVTRGGKSYQFPPLTATITPGGDELVSASELDYIVVGADLVRILMHAIADSHMRTPAVSNATGVKIPVAKGGLEVNDPTITGVTGEEFELIETVSAAVEGTVSAAMGRLIRGISWVSLNNEALATVFESAFGVAARKGTERVMWCWYSCSRGGSEPAGAYGALAAGEPYTVKVVIGGTPRSLQKSE